MADTQQPKLKVVKELRRKEITLALAHVPGGRRVLFGGSDFHVYDVDFAKEKPEPRTLGAHESYVSGLAIASGCAVSGSYDGRLIWWYLETGSRVRTVDAHSKWIRKVAASPDGTLVASVADDMVCRVWNAGTGDKRFDLAGHAAQTPHHFPSMLFACVFSPDGRFLATADKVGHVVVWDVATGKAATTLEVPAMYTWDPIQRRHSIGGIRALAFSPDSVQLAVGGIGQISNIDHLDGHPRVELFEWRSGKRVHTFSADNAKGMIEQLLFLPDGKRLVAVGGHNDGILMLLDLTSRSIALQEKLSSHVNDAALGDSPDLLFTGWHDRVVMHELKG
jgi:WD40 repeat protein